MDFQRILITGGAGFVGCNLAIKFKKRYPNISILALDNLHRRGSEVNVPRLSEYGIDFIHGDIRNTEDFEQIPEFDLLIESSAEPSVLAGYLKSPAYCLNTNLLGTINCLNAAVSNNAKLIFISSNRIYPYGLLNQIPYCEKETRYEWQFPLSIDGVSENGVSETFPLQGPRSLYGATKLCSEIIIEEYVNIYEIDAIINRCGIIAGPWQFGKVDQGICTFWMLAHLLRKPIQYIGYGGTGKQIRDVLHIDDLFELVDKQCTSTKNLDFSVYNVGGGTFSNLSLCEMTSLCREISGNSIQIGSNLQQRFADVRIYISDISKVSSMFNWKPQKGKRMVLQDIYDWLTKIEKSSIKNLSHIFL